jgi:O-antigen/teichoic acid export membrane protein
MIPNLRSWWQDRHLRGIIRNSGYLFSSNGISAVLSALQGIFAARLLTPAGYGLLSGTVIVFATNINRLLSFRMSEVTVRYLEEYMAEGRKDKAGAAAKSIAMAEALTSLVAYLVLLALSPLAARYFAKDMNTVPLFVVYGLVLISNLIYETSTGVLQSTNRFDRLALINVIQSIITASIIFWAFLAKRGLWEVLSAYLLGKTFAGVAIAISAFLELNKTLGPGWWRASHKLLPKWREMGLFALNTNLNGTVNVVVRDSETLLIGFFRSQTEVGYFRVALAIINLVMMPIDPFIGPTYAQITRTITQRQWALTTRLLRRISAISAAWTLSAGGALALFGRWIIPFLYDRQYAPAYPAMAILLVGYGFANIFQWNRPLLLALDLPDYPLKVAAVTSAVKTAFSLALLPFAGYIGEAAILTAYFLASISLILRRGLGVLKQRAEAEPATSDVRIPQEGPSV